MTCCNCSRADNARSLNDIEATLPTEVEAREAAVDEALFDRAGKFLSTHTVELSLPEEVSRSFDEGKSPTSPKKKNAIFSHCRIVMIKFHRFNFQPVARRRRSSRAWLPSSSS